MSNGSKKLFDLGDGMVLDSNPVEVVQPNESNMDNPLKEELKTTKISETVSLENGGQTIVIDETPKVETEEDKPVATGDKPKEEIKSGNEDTSIEENNSPKVHLAATLKDGGILPDLDVEAYEKLETEAEQGAFVKQAFKDLIIKGIESGVDNYKGALTEPQRRMLENFEYGMTAEDVMNIETSRVKYSDITADKLKDNEMLQEKISYDYYKTTTKLSEREILDTIAEKKELGKLESLSLEHSQKMVEIVDSHEANLKTQFKQRQADAIKANDEHLKSIKERINSVNEIFPGIPLEQADKDALYNTMTTPTKEVNGQQLNELLELRAADPILFDIRANYFARLGLFNKEMDLSKITKIAKNEAVDGF